MNINGHAKDFAKKYDRSLVALAVGMGMIFMFYLKMGDIIDRMVERSPSVQTLKNAGDKQSLINSQILEEIKEMRMDFRRVFLDRERR